jgi:Rieske Fe-S protein
MTAVCPHAGCTFGFKNGQMVCPCHTAIFDLNGNYVSGPANSTNPPPLAHLQVSVDGNGNVLVDATTTIDQGKRVQ